MRPEPAQVSAEVLAAVRATLVGRLLRGRPCACLGRVIEALVLVVLDKGPVALAGRAKAIHGWYPGPAAYGRSGPRPESKSGRVFRISSDTSVCQAYWPAR